jgi:cohesin complex subunit SA-1/2
VTSLQAQSRKVQQLSTQIEAFNQHVTSAASAADVAFKSIFMHRYRDVAADIRAEALQCFGTWIVTSPSIFLANSYLKYLGWMLSDQESACVRLFALHSILGIYQELPSEQIPKITEFMVRFRSRIAKMTHDPSSTVAVCAVQALHKAMLFDQLVMSEVQEVSRALENPFPTQRSHPTCCRYTTACWIPILKCVRLLEAFL